DPDPRLVDVGCAVHDAVVDDGRHADADGAIPSMTLHELAGDLGHRRRGGRVGRVDPLPGCDERHGEPVDRGGLHAGPTDVDAEAELLWRLLHAENGTRRHDRALVRRSNGSPIASSRSAALSVTPAAPGVSASIRLPITCRVIAAS